MLERHAVEHDRPAPRPRLSADVGVLRIANSASADRGQYLRWNACRREVFEVELGWKLPPDVPGQLVDAHDAHATFFRAEEGSALIGIVRSLRTELAFPHKAFFEQHLRATGLGRRLETVGTLNALAVIRSQRRRQFVDDGTGRTGTTAALLLDASIDDFVDHGISFVFATVLSLVSARTFMSVGFRVLDTPVPSHDNPGFALANVGAVLRRRRGGGTRPQSDKRIVDSVRNYFDECQEMVLAQGTLEHLFATMHEQPV